MKKSLLLKQLIASMLLFFIAAFTAVNVNAQVHDGANTYATIQAAINAASSGDIITVDAGTYNESNIIVDKALTIQGASRTSVIIAPAITDDHINGGFAAPVSNGFVIRHSDVTIKSLTIDGNGNPSLSGSQNYRQGVITDYNSAPYHYNNSVVTDVSFKNIWRRGLNYYVQDGTVTTGNVLSHSYFDNIGTDPAISGNGFALFFAQSSGTILDNHITNCNTGIVTNFINQYPSYAPVINISQNTISSLISGAFGAIGMNLSGLSSSSTITSNSVDLTGCDNTTENIGVLIYYTSAYPNPADQLLLDNNTVTAAGAHDIGIEVSRQSFGNPSIPPVMVSNNTANGHGATGFLFTDLPSGYGPGAGDAVNATAIGNTANGFTTDFKIQSLDDKVVTVTATNNFIIGGTDGIELDGLNIYTTLNYNSITGQSGYAINAASYTGSPVNATCNWYGSIVPATIASLISGPVNYTPWLTNGTDADPATTGFQPVANSCNGGLSGYYYVNDASLTGDIYTSAVGSDGNPGTAALPFATIQHAINVASAGATIFVDAGTYIENIIVNKEVTLDGAGQALSFVKPALSAPICSGDALCATGSNIMLVQANNVTILNFTLDGDNPKLKSGVKIGGADIDARNGILTDYITITTAILNLNVNHVTVKNVYARGIYASTDGGTFSFTNNTVSNVQGSTSLSVAMFNYDGSGIFANNNVSNSNDGISSNWSRGTEYSGNTVTSSGSGIHTDNNGGYGGTADNIHNNTVSNSTGSAGKGYGIWVFAPYLAVSIDANTVTNMNVGLANFAQNAGVTPIFTNNTVNGQNRGNSIGIYQTSDKLTYGFTSVSGIYTNNFIANNVVGVSLEYYRGTTNTIRVNSNSITGNKIGVQLGTGIKGAGTLVNNFECNWWGTATAAGVKKAIGASFSFIDYIPFLSSGTDISGAAGFQPSGTCTLSTARTYVSGSTDVAIANPNYKPVAFGLSNFPNPFAGTSTIKYDLPFDSKVSIKVYDLMGRVVTTLVDADKKAGTYTVVFNAGSFTKGSLYYRIVAKSKDKQFEQTNKMIQLK